MAAIRTSPRSAHFFTVSTLFAWLGACGTLWAASSTATPANSMAELRELRVGCLESIHTAKARLDELHQFAELQAQRERSAANQLFLLQQNAASAQRRNGELQQEIRRCTNLLARAQDSVQKASTSYRTALDSLPTGENWATEGSAALNELRRAAENALRDTWKYKRLKETEAQFAEALREWRVARRSMEQAGFNLEMRAAPGAVRRVTAQIESTAAELKQLKARLTESQSRLEKLAKQSEQWGTSLRTLGEGEARARAHLAEIGYRFHLVDLKFTAWRLQHADLSDAGIEALPDALEESLSSEFTSPGGLTPLPGAAVASAPGMLVDNFGLGGGAAAKDQDSLEQGDAAFRDLLARVNLAQGRLRFLAQVLQAEFNAVESAISLLERAEDQAGRLAESAGRLAADQESLRRSLESEQQALTKGEDTLDLVKKRFNADLKVINELLDTAADRTATLAKRLER